MQWLWLPYLLILETSAVSSKLSSYCLTVASMLALPVNTEKNTEMNSSLLEKNGGIVHLVDFYRAVCVNYHPALPFRKNPPPSPFFLLCLAVFCFLQSFIFRTVLYAQLNGMGKSIINSRDPAVKKSRIECYSTQSFICGKMRTLQKVRFKKKISKEIFSSCIMYTSLI